MAARAQRIPDTSERPLEVAANLGVEDAGFMLEKLGAECPPEQWVRELNQNAIEGVMSTGQPGTVLWDVDWSIHAQTGTLKLSCTDTGKGMSAEQMNHYLRMLSASGRTRGISANYGIGSKVASVRSPHGLVYSSWTEHGGAQVRLVRAGEHHWGLARQPSGDYFEPLDASEKPPLLADRPSGTQVTILGTTPRENTLLPPDGADGRDSWLLRYLNGRYFDLPQTVTILVRCGLKAARNGTIREHGTLEQVRGQRFFLDANADASGIVDLAGARAHWWLLNDAQADRRRQQHVWISTCHVAALFQGELYEPVIANRGGYQRLQDFGIALGGERVVLYLEPTGGNVTANFVRSRLVVDPDPGKPASGQDLPWAEWAREFRAALPAELTALQQEMAARARASQELGSTLRSLVTRSVGVFALPPYRAARSPRSGTSAAALPGAIDTDARQLGAAIAPGPAPAPPDAAPARPEARSTAAPVEPPEIVDPAEVQAFRLSRQLPREVRWVSVADGTRAPNELEDRAARLDPETRVLTINRDFRLIGAFVERWMDVVGDRPGAREVVESVVAKWVQMILSESIVGAESFRDSPRWTSEQYRALVSEEGLTHALNARLYLDGAIRRDLAQIYKGLPADERESA